MSTFNGTCGCMTPTPYSFVCILSLPLTSKSVPLLLNMPGVCITVYLSDTTCRNDNSVMFLLATKFAGCANLQSLVPSNPDAL